PLEQSAKEEEARKEGKKQTQLYSGIPIDAILKELRTAKDAMPHLVEIGKRLYGEGKTKYSDFQGRMKEVLGDMWDKFKSQVRRAFEQVVAWNKKVGERGAV